MTVCIAAVAADAKAIVLLADKSVSYDVDGVTRQRFDVAFNKIRPLDAQGWAAMICGQMDIGERVVHLGDELYSFEVAKQGESEPVVVKGVPECMKNAFQACRNVEIEDSLLKPRLLSRAWYEARLSEPNAWEKNSYVRDIEKQIADFWIDSTILLCGFENKTPEIYLIVSPGVVHSESAAGLAASGIGADTALNRLYALETDPGDPIEKVLYDVYDAKEACSQSLSEVGVEWDAFVVVDGKPPARVPATIQDLIETLYSNEAKSPFEAGKAKPKKWRSRLEEWSASLLAN